MDVRGSVHDEAGGRGWAVREKGGVSSWVKLASISSSASFFKETSAKSQSSQDKVRKLLDLMNFRALKSHNDNMNNALYVCATLQFRRYLHKHNIFYPHNPLSCEVVETNIIISVLQIRDFHPVEVG